MTPGRKTIKFARQFESVIATRSTGKYLIRRAVSAAADEGQSPRAHSRWPAHDVR